MKTYTYEDSLYGIIVLGPLAYTIVNTPIFGRLRNIKQLGLVDYVTSSANHTRFSHSLGVYYLAGKMLDVIKQKHPNITFSNKYLGNNVKLSNKIIEYIKIGGLCHDIGHGPFSHIFDDIILKDSTHPNKSHEKRSELLIEILMKSICPNIEKKYINFIQSIVNPSDEDVGWVYQIVSNNKNGIDVDKFDYISRDVRFLSTVRELRFDSLFEVRIDNNGNLCYPKYTDFPITELFHARYSLHKQLYQNNRVKLLEYYLSEIYKLMDPILHITKSIENMDSFITFTDATVFQHIEHQDRLAIPRPYRPFVEKATDLYKIFNNASLRYRYIGQYMDTTRFLTLDDFITPLTPEPFSNISAIDPSANPLVNPSVFDPSDIEQSTDVPSAVEQSVVEQSVVEQSDVTSAVDQFETTLSSVNDMLKKDVQITADDILILTTIISYSSKPSLSNIYLYEYDDNENLISHEMNHNVISSMMSERLPNEYISFVYMKTKSPTKMNIIKTRLKALENNNKNTNV